MAGVAISSLPVTTTKQDKDLSAVRPGQIFSMENAREMADRDPYGDFLAYGLPEKAIGLGFEVIDDDDKPIKDWDEKWKIIEPEWKKIFGPGAGFSRTFGRSILLLGKSDSPDTKDQPFIKIFEPIFIEKITYYNDGSLMGIKLKDRDPNTGTDVPYIVGDIQEEGTEKSDNDIANVYELLNKSKQYFWEAGSYFEPIWDELLGLRLIRTGAVLFAIRVGAGLKIVKIPPGTDDDTITELKTAAKRLDSLNGWFIVPVADAEIEIETGTGMVDYDALKQALLGSLATKTGYPKAGFEGIEMERQGGSFNEERVNDAERIIQRKYKHVAKWLTIHLSDYHGWDITEENFKMQWVRREIIDDRQQAELEEINARKYQLLINSGVLSEQDVRDELGYDGTAPGPPNQFGINVSGLNPPLGDDESEEEENV